MRVLKRSGKSKLLVERDVPGADFAREFALRLDDKKRPYELTVTTLGV